MLRVESLLLLCLAMPASAATFVEANGVVSMEAEHFTHNNGYTLRNDNAPNNAAAGWSGEGWVYSDSSAAQRLDYSIHFSHVGTYYVQLRALAGFNGDWSSNLEGLDNGFHAEFDGVRISGHGIYVRKMQSWYWFARPQNGSDSDPISFSVTTPGLHTFSIVRRENLSRLDKIVLHNGTYGTSGGSSLSGVGPAETVGTGGLADAGVQRSDAGLEQLTTRIEAEHMLLQSYRIEDGSGYASGNAYISLKGGSSDEVGTASTTFGGGAGRYNIVLSYFDENDGEAHLEVRVDNVQAASFWLDQDLGDNRGSAITRVRRVVATNFAISRGASIVITGSETPEEPARVDCLELQPVAGHDLDAGGPDIWLPDSARPDARAADSGPVVDSSASVDTAADVGVATDAGAQDSEDLTGGDSFPASSDNVAKTVGGCAALCSGAHGGVGAVYVLLCAVVLRRRR